MLFLLALLTFPRLVWEQPAPTLKAAKGYTYWLYVDQEPGIPLTGVSCKTLRPGAAECAVKIWPLRCGDHQLTLRATRADGTSEPSQPLMVTFRTSNNCP